MKHRAGLDVSVKSTAICIVEETGKIARDAKVTTELEAIVALDSSPENRTQKEFNLNPAVGDCMFGPNRRNSKRWTHFSQRFRLTLRVNNHR
jgi:hypothetical protein